MHQNKEIIKGHFGVSKERSVRQFGVSKKIENVGHVGESKKQNKKKTKKKGKRNVGQFGVSKKNGEL